MLLRTKSVNLRSTYLWITLVLSVGLLLSGCSDKPLKSAEEFVEAVKEQPVQKVEPLPEIQKVQSVKYTSQNLRSPFTKEQQIISSGITPDMNRPKEELEQFPLDSLQMVGTLSQGNRTWALISMPNKSVYRVTVGSHIGQNYGRITDVQQNKIEIVETVPDGLGGWKERNASLSLTK